MFVIPKYIKEESYDSFSEIGTAGIFGSVSRSDRKNMD
jgi:hypothetical protein